MYVIVKWQRFEIFSAEIVLPCEILADVVKTNFSIFRQVFKFFYSFLCVFCFCFFSECLFYCFKLLGMSNIVIEKILHKLALWTILVVFRPKNSISFRSFFSFEIRWDFLRLQTLFIFFQPSFNVFFIHPYFIWNRIKLHLHLVKKKSSCLKFVCTDTEWDEKSIDGNRCFHAQVVIYRKQKILLSCSFLQNLYLIHRHSQIMPAIIIYKRVITTCKTYA